MDARAIKVRAVKRVGATLLAFQQQGTPQGAEYARRLRIALVHILRDDYEQAKHWISLVDVPEEQA